MSIVDTFDAESEDIIKPTDFGVEGHSFPSVAVSTFMPGAIKYAVRRLNAEQIGAFNGYQQTKVYKFLSRGLEIGLFQSMPGAPLTVSLLERYIGRGGRKLIFFGSCGVLDSSIPARHFIVPTAAYRDEGISYHYAPADDYIEIRTAAKLSKIFCERGIPFINGKTWTTDAIYRETQASMKKRKAEGCLAVEMECASIMAFAEFRGVEAYQFLYAEDNLDSDIWDPRSLGMKNGSLNERTIDAALEVALAIA